MKKLKFIPFILFFLFYSCGKLKKDKIIAPIGQPQEIQTQKEIKSESKIVEETVKSKALPSIEFKTKTGKSFIVEEKKPSASISTIKITPKGFTEINNPMLMEESDPFDYALVADINNDGFDELYIITRSAGSGSYAKIYGFASNKDKSVTPIYIPELSDDDFVALFQGYMGHDIFYIEDNKLLRKYPVYEKEDSNSNPTGGDKIFQYKLKMGEASWILEIMD
jgi:hypothetical protein